MPRELENMGVHSLITFDAHDPRMHNTVPLMSMENVSPALFLRIFPKTSKTARHNSDADALYSFLFPPRSA